MYNYEIDSDIILGPDTVNMLREEAVRSERYGELTVQQLNLIYENKWFHLLVPKAYGGLEYDLPKFVGFIEFLASIDGSFAWNINLGAGANMFSGYLNPLIAEPLFRNPKMCIAGSGANTGSAHKLKDSYRINGCWKYASGAKHATHFSFNAVTAENKTDISHSRSFIIPREQVEVMDSWHPIGLVGTGSHDFRIRNGIVSPDFSFDLTAPTPYSLGALYKFPFQILAEVNMLVMTTGLAKRFFDIVTQIRISSLKQKNSTFDKECFERFENLCKVLTRRFLDARGKVYHELNRLWKENEDGKLNVQKETDSFTIDIIKAAEMARNLVDGLYPFIGMQGVFPCSEANRVWRDFKAASQHALLSPNRMKIDPHFNVSNFK